VWTGVLGFDTVVNVVARMTSCVMVGFPMCQDPGFLDIAVNVAIDVVKARIVINLFPPFLKPYVARLVSPTPRNIERCKPYLKGLIDERIRSIDEGKSKPQDCLMHALIDELTPEGYCVDDLISALFVLVFAALHSTAMSFTHALFEVAANPEYATLLRNEAETVFQEARGVWTKDAIAQLRVTDSVLKEALRVYGANATSLFRKAMVDITFSDGTFIPKGTLVLAAAHHVQFNKTSYPDPEVFNPIRFVEPETDEENGVSQSMTTLRVDYLPFGMGKHACPGRFFAALQMKMLLAHLVMTYDIQFENGGPRPLETWRGSSVIPNRAAQLYLRTRR